MSEFEPHVVFGFSELGDLNLSISDSDVDGDVLDELLAWIETQIKHDIVDHDLKGKVRFLINAMMRAQVESGALVYNALTKKWTRPSSLPALPSLPSLPSIPTFPSIEPPAIVAPPCSPIFEPPVHGPPPHEVGTFAGIKVIASPHVKEGEILLVSPKGVETIATGVGTHGELMAEVSKMKAEDRELPRSGVCIEEVVTPGIEALPPESTMKLKRGKSKAEDYEALKEIVGRKGVVIEPPSLSTTIDPMRLKEFAVRLGIPEEEVLKEMEEAGLIPAGRIDDEDDDELELECGEFDDLPIEEPEEEPVGKAPEDEPLVVAFLTDSDTGVSIAFQHFEFTRRGTFGPNPNEYQLTLRVSDMEMEVYRPLFGVGKCFHFATSDDRISEPLIVVSVWLDYHATERETRVHLEGVIGEGT